MPHRHLIMSITLILSTLSFFTSLLTAGPVIKNTNSASDDPIGELYLAGHTWCDVQHWGSCGRQIQIDSGGWIHLVWMNGMNSGASQRHIFYQLYTPDLMNSFIGGVRINWSNQAGFPTLALHSDDRAMPCFQQQCQIMGGSSYTPDLSVLAFDFVPHYGAFLQAQPLPFIINGNDTALLRNPKISKDINHRYHIISTEDLDSTSTTLSRRIYYCGAEYDPFSFEIIFDPQQTLVGITTTISADAASSPVSEKSAIAWLQPCATQSDTNLYDNDLIICFSDDGQDWNFNDTLNLTNWIPPDWSLLPDTLAATKDTLRCFTDICLLFDYNDALHVFFTTISYDAIQNIAYPKNSFIWHWDDYNQKFSLVASGWYTNGTYNPGYLNAYAQRPSAGLDEDSGELYCAYQRYLPPAFPIFPFPYYQADTTDFSAGNFPNSEIWLSKSVNNGLTWSEGIDITNSHTPNAPSGECESEISPSLASQVDDFCHLIYILDKDAGAAEIGEGRWTYNDVVYHRVSVEDIPVTPFLDAFPMHCDSTAMPPNLPPPVLNFTITLSPQPPQIVIPYSGGNVLFDLSVHSNCNYFCLYDVWTTISDPQGNTSIFFLETNQAIYPGQTDYFNDITRCINANCPAGTYTVHAYVGLVHEEIIWQDAFFTFIKTPFSEVNSPADNNSLPAEYRLYPPSPNPFNPHTAISIDLPANGNVSLIVYDLSGRKKAVLIDGWKSAGRYCILFDGSNLSSGIYFVRFTSAAYTAVEKMALVK